MSPAEIIARVFVRHADVFMGQGAGKNRYFPHAPATADWEDYSLAEQNAGDQYATAIRAALEAEGFVVVPVEPTPEMLASAKAVAFRQYPGKSSAIALDVPAIYRALLSARPR